MSIVAVAKKAGVSIATVSRVLNEIPVVNEKTVAQVRKAIVEVGYRPVRLRRPRQTAGRGRAVSVQLQGSAIAVLNIGGHPGWLQMPVMASVLSGISRSARENDLRLILEDISPAGDLKRLRDMAGAIAFIQPPLDEQLLLKISQNIPLVWVMGGESHRGVIDHVSADNVGIGYMAFKHLRDCGCTRFAYITDAPEWPLMRSRGQAFMNAATDDGKAVTSYIVQNDRVPLDTYGNARAADTLEGAVEHLCRAYQRGTGLFIPTDLLTTQIYPMLIARGIEPANDLQIISCDNEEVRLSLLHPRPTSIDLGGEDIGRVAVQQLMARIAAPDSPIVRLQVSPRCELRSNPADEV